MNLEYRFAGANDGRLWQRKDWMTGEEVTYIYDAVGRLQSAATTTTDWGLAWTYDGFGNLLQQTETQGAPPTFSVTADPATNRMSGVGYDPNGNMLGGVGYDIENRRNNYWYSAANQRLLSKEAYRPVLWFYGLDEELLGQFELQEGGDPPKRYPVLKEETERIYARGRLLLMGGQSVSTDRLGSVVRQGTANLRYYAYGEEMGGATAQNRTKFATYTRDVDGTDYAWNRQYGAITGRFMTPDPYRAGGGAGDPGSWNRYSYVQNDPVNYYDRTGLQAENPTYCSPDLTLAECDEQRRVWGYPTPGSGGGGIGFVGVQRSRGEILSGLRHDLGAAALAMLSENLDRTEDTAARVPAFLQVVGDCWQDGVQGGGSLAYTRIVTYQILDSAGEPMGQDYLAGVAISERFREVIGNTGIEKSPGTWVYGARNGIRRNGTFEDFLSAGGLPPAFPRSGGAFQAFTASGFLSNGLPLVPQPLRVLGFGAATTVLDNTYGPDNVTINGTGYGRNPSKRCP